jgi:hypothetical protein
MLDYLARTGQRASELLKSDPPVPVRRLKLGGTLLLRMRNYRRTSCPSRILNFTVFVYSAYYPGCERCHQAPAASVGAAACKFIRIRHHHGGEEAAEGAARRESEATAPRHRGVRPVDGVAVQAAHHLGAPRRRLPSHVSKCNRRPRSLLLVGACLLM